MGSKERSAQQKDQIQALSRTGSAESSSNGGKSLKSLRLAKDRDYETELRSLQIELVKL